MKRFLVVGLRGGLGNQLFQYASGYGIATRLGGELLLDPDRVRADEQWLPRLLGPHYREPSRAQLLRIGVTHTSNRWRARIPAFALRRGVDVERRLRGQSPPTLVLETLEQARGYHEIAFSVDLPARILGYLQSERYFAGVADEVARRLRFPPVALPRPEQGRPVVAVSFRRGDYVRIGWQLPLSYYGRAIALLQRKVPDASFLVLGDDPEFVRLVTDWVGRYGPATNAYDVADGTLEHMALAIQCDHVIMANSSYAWWSAWLGDRRAGDGDRVVIAPEKYLQANVDVLPDRWTVVPSD